MKSTTKILVLALCVGAMNGVVWGQPKFGDFQTRKSGSWHDPTVWETYVSPGFWSTVLAPPSGKGQVITILPIHKIDITTPNVSVDTLVVNGWLYVHGYGLTVKDSLVVTVLNGEDGVVYTGELRLLEGGRLAIGGGLAIPDKAKCLIVGLLQVGREDKISDGTFTLAGGSINNLGEVEINGTFEYRSGCGQGNPFKYGASGSFTMYQDPPPCDLPQINMGSQNLSSATSLDVFWPATNGPTNVTVPGNVTLNGTRTIRGTLRLEGSSARINNLGEILIEGTFVRGLGSGLVTGNPLRYGTNGSLTISNYYGVLDVIDDENLFWPATNGPANVTVVSDVTLNAKRTIAGTLDVPIKLHVAGTLTSNGTTKVTGGLEIGGTFINNGMLQAVTGGIEVSGKLTNNGATQLNWFTLQPGGAVSGKDLVYDKTWRGTLVLNSSHTINDTTVFWPRQNGPANVKIPRSINVTVNAARAVSDILQIDGTLQVADTLTTNETNGGGTLQVDGTLIANGTTRVGTLLVAGTLTNYGTLENGYFSTCHVSGKLTNIGTARSFAPFQVAGILTNNGTMQIDGLYPFRVAGVLTNNGAMQIEGTFQLDQGGTANGSDFTYGEDGTLIFNNSSNSYDVNSASVYWPSTNGPVDVKVQGAGGITLNVARAVSRFETAGSVRKASNLTVSGSVSINAGGFFDSSAVVYSGEATLFYNSGDSHNVSGEWGSGASVGSGVPKNVLINPGRTVIMPSSPRTCPGYLRNYGTLVLSTTPGADLSVGGDWENNGTFEPNSRVVIFNGKTEQMIGPARRMNTFDYLTINNPAGILVEGQPGGGEGGEGGDDEIASVTVQQALTFTAGNIKLRLADLTLAGPVSGAASNRHVVTYEKGRVVRAIAGGGNFQFPIGPTETSYNPVAIALAPTDSTETFSVGVDSTINLGAPEGSLFVQRTWDIQEATPGDNHAALTFQWAGAEEGAKFTRNASSTYLNGVELVPNGMISGTDPYMVSTKGEFPCTEFSAYTVGTSGTVAVEASHNGFPTSFILSQNHPNPFNPSTTIRYAIPQAGEVTLKVYNLVGAEIETLVKEKQPAGEHTIRWNPVGLPSGVYLYRLEVEEASPGLAQKFVATKKLILLQ